jgi:hypothetical protein
MAWVLKVLGHVAPDVDCEYFEHLVGWFIWCPDNCNHICLDGIACYLNFTEAINQVICFFFFAADYDLSITTTVIAASEVISYFYVAFIDTSV